MENNTIDEINNVFDLITNHKTYLYFVKIINNDYIEICYSYSNNNVSIDKGTLIIYKKDINKINFTKYKKEVKELIEQSMNSLDDDENDEDYLVLKSYISEINNGAKIIMEVFNENK